MVQASQAGFWTTSNKKAKEADKNRAIIKAVEKSDSKALKKALKK